MLECSIWLGGLTNFFQLMILVLTSQVWFHMHFSWGKKQMTLGDKELNYCDCFLINYFFKYVLGALKYFFFH